MCQAVLGMEDTKSTKKGNSYINGQRAGRSRNNCKVVWWLLVQRGYQSAAGALKTENQFCSGVAGKGYRGEALELGFEGQLGVCEAPSRRELKTKETPWKRHGGMALQGLRGAQ